MTYARRQFLQGATAFATAPAITRRAWALDYPTRAIRMIVPFPAGGAADISGRVIGQWLSDRLGQPFVIENRPGGGTNIGTEAVATAQPDGYTLLVANAGNAINASLYHKLNFNFIHDLVPVAGVVRAPHVLFVTPSFPAKTVEELIGKRNGIRPRRDVGRSIGRDLDGVPGAQVGRRQPVRRRR